jgi:hypothetical protein
MALGELASTVNGCLCCLGSTPEIPSQAAGVVNHHYPSNPFTHPAGVLTHAKYPAFKPSALFAAEVQ